MHMYVGAFLFLWQPATGSPGPSYLKQPSDAIIVSLSEKFLIQTYISGCYKLCVKLSRYMYLRAPRPCEGLWWPI